MNLQQVRRAFQAGYLAALEGADRFAAEDAFVASLPKRKRRWFKAPSAATATNPPVGHLRGLWR